MQYAGKKLLTCAGLWSILTLAAQEKSPFIDRVYRFHPAPGQFINVSPEYEPGDTQEDMRRKAEQLLAGGDGSTVSLGAYGGYVVFGFDHPVINVPGEADFRVLGNVIANAVPGALAESSEPGIVAVSHDANGNGLPDDEWYELAGSEYHKPETGHHYRITYYRPEAGKTPVPSPDDPQLIDTAYIRWTDNLGNCGFVARNKFHLQPYYPEWVDADSVSFEGTRLRGNSVLENGVWRLFAFERGYADNHPNADPRSGLDIGRAVDGDGRPVHLPEIHFIKVYTAVNQSCGLLGETSTEIRGAVDLHPDAVAAASGTFPRMEETRLLGHPVTGVLRIESPRRQTAHVFGMNGVRQMTFALECGINTVHCSRLPAGCYILATGDRSIKFLKH
jgi:hypothetical protein